MFLIKPSLCIAVIAVLFAAAPIARAASDAEPVATAVTTGGQTHALSKADCMRPDLDFVIWLEQHGEAQDMPGQQIFQKFMTVMRARAACREGRVAEGLALYDGLLMPSTVGSGEQRAGGPAPR